MQKIPIFDTVFDYLVQRWLRKIYQLFCLCGGTMDVGCEHFAKINNNCETVAIIFYRLVTKTKYVYDAESRRVQMYKF